MLRFTYLTAATGQLISSSRKSEDWALKNMKYTSFTEIMDTQSNLLSICLTMTLILPFRLFVYVAKQLIAWTPDEEFANIQTNYR